jgi:LPS export ABC transporter permease LptG/LPS export ABC transporter permease LptF
MSLLAMRILDRHICREILSHTLLALVIFTFVIFVPQLVQMMNVVARHSGRSWQTAQLFLTAFPRVLTFSVPIALLVGVLIALGRMSADSELVALNAAGIALRHLLVPVGVVALLAFGLTLSMTLWLGPMSIRTLRVLENRLRNTQVSFEVQPRIFNEQFPRLVLYVQDVSAAAMHWHGVFLAESDAGDVSRLTLAEDAIVVADRNQGKLELYLHNGGVHEASTRNPNHYGLSAFGERDLLLGADLVAGSGPETINAERPLAALMAAQGAQSREARVEFHRRLAFPAACLVFALLALPLGSRRHGGRSTGFVIALLLVCAYYFIFIFCAGLARAGTVPVWLGIWAANIAMAAAGIALLRMIDRTPGESRVAHALDSLRRWTRRRNQKAENGSPAATAGSRKLSEVRGSLTRRSGGFPQLLDLYLFRNFVYYFLLLLVGFILLFEIFTFFDLLDDIAQHRTELLVVLDYFRYLSFFLLYQLAPLACLVSILVTLGVMTKNNELVAIKAAGVSLYRLTLPLLLAGIGVTAGLILLDQSYLPYANQRSEALRNIIKGRPAQTYYQPQQQQWIVGNNSHIYNYQLFDPDRLLFGGLNIFELNAQDFSLRRRVYAQRARWEPQQHAWILESGWLRDFQDGSVVRYMSFPVLELPELDEPPSYFTREIRQSSQMNWWELRNYIARLRQSGFEVDRFSVQLQKKLAFPLIAPIVILLAIPFSILVGTRGAVGGLVLGIALAIGYWAASSLFEAMGAVGQLPPTLSAWSPDLIFAFTGIYFFLNMPT